MKLPPLFGPFDTDVLTPADPSTSLGLQFQIEGWDWFLITSIQCNINNATGLATARMNVILANLTAVFFFLVEPNGVPAAQSNQFLAGLGLPYNAIAGGVLVIPLPWVPVQGRARLDLALIGGDVNTRYQSISINLLGHKRPQAGRRA